jgi:hypothetical protein
MGVMLLAISLGERARFGFFFFFFVDHHHHHHHEHTSTGTVIPLLMEACRIDPAHAGPVVAVMVDLCGVAIICTVCNAILSPVSARSTNRLEQNIDVLGVVLYSTHRQWPDVMRTRSMFL